jgi:hypothetical protein
MHHPGQFLSMVTETSVSPDPAKKYGYFINYEFNYLLENSDPSMGFVCNGSLNFAFDDCLYKKISAIMMEEFGCISYQ